jgi:transcriptional regulator with XRE-family HTH domain
VGWLIQTFYENKLHNRLASRFLFTALEARGWTESKLAKAAGVARSVISTQLSGARRIRPNHLHKYLAVLNHQERPLLLVAWLRDNLPPDQIEHLLNPTGDKLSLNVALDDDGKRMLGWWAREMARDSELRELFKLLSARAGYHPKRTAAGPAKRRRRGGGALVALLIFAFMLREDFAFAPPVFPRARQARPAAIALFRRECFLPAAAEPA